MEVNDKSFEVVGQTVELLRQLIKLEYCKGDNFLERLTQ